jgi:hypothetical protein
LAAVRSSHIARICLTTANTPCLLSEKCHWLAHSSSKGKLRISKPSTPLPVLTGACLFKRGCLWGGMLVCACNVYVSLSVCVCVCVCVCADTTVCACVSLCVGVRRACEHVRVLCCVSVFCVSCDYAFWSSCACTRMHAAHANACTQHLHSPVFGAKCFRRRILAVCILDFNFVNTTTKIRVRAAPQVF